MQQTTQIVNKKRGHFPPKDTQTRTTVEVKKQKFTNIAYSESNLIVIVITILIESTS